MLSLIDSLRGRIVLTFPVAQAPRPLLIPVSPYGEIDGELAERIDGHVWIDVDATEWQQVATAVGAIRLFAHPRSLAYYTPSVLIGCLDAKLPSVYGLEWILPANKNYAPRGEWWTSYAGYFSASQRRTLVEFANHIAATTDALTSENHLAKVAVELWK